MDIVKNQVTGSARVVLDGSLTNWVRSVNYYDDKYRNIPLKLRQAKIGIFISVFFLLVLLLIWKLSNRKKWINTYEEVGNRPWLYPDDKTIKNPWKRFKNRLFKK